VQQGQVAKGRQILEQTIKVLPVLDKVHTHKKTVPEHGFLITTF